MARTVEIEPKVVEKDDSTGLEDQRIKIRVLNSKESHVVPNHMIAPFYEPKPSDILNHPHGTDGVCSLAGSLFVKRFFMRLRRSHSPIF